MIKIKNLLLFFIALSAATTLQAQQADAIVGTYSVTSPNSDNKAKIQVFRAKNGTYFGKYTWTSAKNADGSPVLDLNNQDKSKRNRPIIGLVTFWNLTFKDGEYIGGSIYDPVSGKTYSIKGKMASNGRDVEVRYYWKRPALGKDAIWKRIDH